MAEAAKPRTEPEQFSPKTRQKKIEDETRKITGFLLEMHLKETAMNHKIARWERKVSEVEARRPGYYS